MSFRDYRKNYKNKEQKQNNEEVTEIKALEECTEEELLEVIAKENVVVSAEATIEEMITAINSKRAEVNMQTEPEVKEEDKDNEPTIVKTTGIVNANKLNVRKEASKDADVLTVISKGTGVGINLTNSTEEFYCVSVMVNGELATGYCMREFISTNK